MPEEGQRSHASGGRSISVENIEATEQFKRLRLKELTKEATARTLALFLVWIFATALLCSFGVGIYVLVKSPALNTSLWLIRHGRGVAIELAPAIDRTVDSAARVYDKPRPRRNFSDIMLRQLCEGSHEILRSYLDSRRAQGACPSSGNH